MLHNEGKVQPETLFDIAMRFVSINAESLHSLIGFPEIVGRKIFDQFINLNEYALCPNDHQVKILSCFEEAYKELILESIALADSLIVFNEYFDSFMVLFQFISELCLCSCYLGDNHELFEHLYSFSLLKKLCLKRNCLTGGAIRKITLPIRMFNKGPKNVEHFDLSDNMFTDEIVPSLAVFQKLQCLDLSGSFLSSKSIHDLERNCSLKLSPSENTIHPIVSKGWSLTLVEKWQDACRLRRKKRDIVIQDLYYSVKRFRMAKKSISDSSYKIPNPYVKLIFQRQVLTKESITDKSTCPKTSESLPNNPAVSYQKLIEDDLFAQYL